MPRDKTKRRLRYPLVIDRQRPLPLYTEQQLHELRKVYETQLVTVAALLMQCEEISDTEDAAETACWLMEDVLDCLAGAREE